MSRIAGPPYRTESQWHGPCYVLDPDEWANGWREVIAVIPAIPPRRRRVRIYAAARRVFTGETRRVVTFPKGRPWDTRLVDAPVLRREPRWHTRARELRARGVSVRAIMHALHIRAYRKVYDVLKSAD